MYIQIPVQIQTKQHFSLISRLSVVIEKISKELLEDLCLENSNFLQNCCDSLLSFTWSTFSPLLFPWVVHFTKQEFLFTWHRLDLPVSLGAGGSMGSYTQGRQILNPQGWWRGAGSIDRSKHLHRATNLHCSSCLSHGPWTQPKKLCSTTMPHLLSTKRTAFPEISYTFPVPK